MKKLAKQQNQQFTAPAGNTYTFVQSQPYQMQQQYRQMPPQDSFHHYFTFTQEIVKKLYVIHTLYLVLLLENRKNAIISL